MSFCPQPLGHHFDDSWKAWLEPERKPERKPRAAAPVEATGPILTEAEVIAICRAHFATFANLTVAAEHYGLTDGRLSQIQTGVFVSCPRVQNALGIKRDRSGVYRWIGEPVHAVAERVEPAPEATPQHRKPCRPRPHAGDIVRKPEAGISVGLATRQELIVEPDYLQGLKFGSAA